MRDSWSPCAGILPAMIGSNKVQESIAVVTARTRLDKKWSVSTRDEHNPR